jgi:transglutaminase-like putative cysteine protease
MKLTCESTCLDDYLLESEELNFSHRLIQKLTSHLFTPSQSDIEKAKAAFEFVRDKISHSWDIQSSRVTCKASDVLNYTEGICYAKSNLLASLLRSQEIPTGFCYQRLMLFDTPDQGYCIHALNAVFLKSINQWVRLDARGNKPGINAEFSIPEEKLAFPIHPEYDEIDYPIIFTKPHPKTIDVLQRHTNCMKMYQFGLPASI